MVDTNIEDAEIVSETTNEETTAVPEKKDPYTLIVTLKCPGRNLTDNFIGMEFEMPEDKVTPELCERMILNYKAVTLADKRTTLVTARLRNNFIITETSTCLRPEDYDPEMGTQICIQKIRDKIWGFMSFMLASATVTNTRLTEELVASGELTAEDLQKAEAEVRAELAAKENAEETPTCNGECTGCTCQHEEVVEDIKVSKPEKPEMDK